MPGVSSSFAVPLPTSSSLVGSGAYSLAFTAVQPILAGRRYQTVAGLQLEVELVLALGEHFLVVLEHSADAEGGVKDGQLHAAALADDVDHGFLHRGVGGVHFLFGHGLAFLRGDLHNMVQAKGGHVHHAGGAVEGLRGEFVKKQGVLDHKRRGLVNLFLQSYSSGFCGAVGSGRRNYARKVCPAFLR